MIKVRHIILVINHQINQASIKTILSNKHFIPFIFLRLKFRTLIHNLLKYSISGEQNNIIQKRKISQSDLDEFF